jgi:hypothetical protein
LFFFGPNIFHNIFLSKISNFFSSDFVITQVLLAYIATGLTKALYNVTLGFLDSSFDLNNGSNLY